MKLKFASAVALALPLLLGGCSLFPTTRKLPVPKPPQVTQTVSPEELIERMNGRWKTIETLTATVEIQASVLKAKEGSAKDYPSLHGHILLRKPAMLRALGSYFGARWFDMASDGKEFTLSIPVQNRAIKGSNKLRKRSENALENLRPDFFLDALTVRGLEEGDQYMVTLDTDVVADAAKKHLLSFPEYIVTVMRPGGNRGLKMTPVRVVTFHRDDLEPYKQDIYDAEGNIETEVTYGGYQDFEGNRYPSAIVIKRPIEEVQIVLAVDDVKENLPLTDDQFVPQVAEGATIKHLE